MKIYTVYIITNKPQGTLYIGVTSSLQRRLIEHKLELNNGFTKKYNLKKLVYVEHYDYVYNALEREKQLKHWHREWKINLIESQNPKWEDLYEEFFGPYEEILKQVQDDNKGNDNRRVQDNTNGAQNDNRE
jgi:putative endonuclease